MRFLLKNHWSKIYLKKKSCIGNCYFWNEYVKMKSINLEIVSENDNKSLKEVIQTVFLEHGINRPGTAFFDPCLDDMYSFYTGEKMIYFVAKDGDKVIGGSGVYPTEGLPDETCELVKMYLLKEYRGKGIGRSLIEKTIQSAKDFGYKNIYLETTPELNSAIKMYEKFGFSAIENRMGNTGHHSCGIFMLKEI